MVKAKRFYKKVSDRVADYRANTYQKFVYKQKRQLKSKVGRMVFEKEQKFLDTALSFNFDATAEVPATGQLCIIPQDDTQSGREGRKVVVSSVYIKGRAVYATAANQPSICYLYLMQDTQCNGAAATVGNANTGVFTTTNLCTAMRTLANVDRFKVLKRWEIKMKAQAGITTSFALDVQSVNGYVKCNIPLEYDASAATGAIGTIRSNNIFLVAGSDGSADTVSFEGTCRLRFVG